MEKVPELPLIGEEDNWQAEWLEILNLCPPTEEEKTEFERKRKGSASNEEGTAKTAKTGRDGSGSALQ